MITYRARRCVQAEIENDPLIRVENAPFEIISITAPVSILEVIFFWEVLSSDVTNQVVSKIWYIFYFFINDPLVCTSFCYDLCPMPIQLYDYESMFKGLFFGEVLASDVTNQVVLKIW